MDTTFTGPGHQVMRQGSMYKTKKIILASASPRRKEILEKTGLKFMVDASDYEEDLSSANACKKTCKVFILRKG